MDERRQQDRYKIAGRATLSVGEPPAAAPVRLIDIGLSGMSFLCDLALPAGTAAGLDLSVFCRQELISVHAPIVVRYCILERRMYRIGALFADLDDGASAAIRSIVEARAQR